MNHVNFKKLSEFQDNNEFYIQLIQKLENLKFKVCCQDLNLYKSIINYIYNDENLYLLSKLDKRKLKKDHMEEFRNKFKEHLKNNTLELSVEEFFNDYYCSYNIVKKINDKKDLHNQSFLFLMEYQKYLLDKVVYLNYPYVFKKITDYVKFNETLKKYINDIENTTINMLINSIIKFDIKKDNKFITYLSYWIRYGISEEINYINKDNNSSKFTGKTKSCFTNTDFTDKKLKNLMKYPHSIKQLKELKLEQNKSFRKNIENMKLMKIDLFTLFNVDEKTLTQSKLTKFLNSILINKEKRLILYTYLQNEDIKCYFDNNGIEIQNNKVSLYRCLNLVFLNDFHYNTTPICNIDDVTEHHHLSIEYNHDHDDIYDKLSQFLNENENKVLEQFKEGEIDELPSKIKRKIANLIHYNNEEEKICVVYPSNKKTITKTKYVNGKQEK